LAYKILKATSQELKTLDQAITDFNIQVATELPKAEIHRLDFSAKNEPGELLGGIQAYWVNWGILHVELVYVFESYRDHGIASGLLQHVEQIAKQNKCHIAHLDTFDFQAKDFYLKQGYAIFGTLDNTPKGHCRYYMKKEL
jgi:GNAT superfamily N-acetyltransferase